MAVVFSRGGGIRQSGTASMGACYGTCSGAQDNIVYTNFYSSFILKEQSGN